MAASRERLRRVATYSWTLFPMVSRCCSNATIPTADRTAHHDDLHSDGNLRLRHANQGQWNGNSQRIGAKRITKAYNFDKPGTYNVEASATLAGNTITKSIQIAYPDNSGSKPYPGGVPKMGAVENSDGSVTFCLAAPARFL